MGLEEGAGEAARIDAAECVSGSGEGDAVADRVWTCVGWGEAAAEDTTIGGATGEPGEEVRRMNAYATFSPHFGMQEHRAPSSTHYDTISAD